MHNFRKMQSSRVYLQDFIWGGLLMTAQSSCLLSRLHHTAPGAKEAAKRRAAAKGRESLAQMDQRAHFEAHVRGRRLRNIGVLRI